MQMVIHRNRSHEYGLCLLAIAGAARMLELLGKEEVEPLEREDGNCSQFPV